jgi:hypothetical protein
MTLIVYGDHTEVRTRRSRESLHRILSKFQHILNIAMCRFAFRSLSL